jgi:aspartate 1-decarboxylase
MSARAFCWPPGDGEEARTAMLTMLKSKIHRARVTGADVSYEGSISLDPILMEAADILPFERVQVLDIDNGARLETYAIEGRRGSGEVSVNGAAAHLVQAGDTIIVLTYRTMDEEEARSHRPRLVYVDENNQVVRVAETVTAA